MGGLVLSTLGTLAPQAYSLFALIVAVGFFGVYVPWNEKKKRAGNQRPGERPERRPVRPMDRSQALLALLLCLPLAAVGLTLLMAGAVMGETLLLLIGVALSMGSLAGAGRAGQVLWAAPRQKPPRTRPDPVGRRERDRLDQLEALRDAGILTPEEYRERQAEILEGRK